MISDRLERGLEKEKAEPMIKDSALDKGNGMGGGNERSQKCLDPLNIISAENRITLSCFFWNSIGESFPFVDDQETTMLK